LCGGSKACYGNCATGTGRNIAVTAQLFAAGEPTAINAAIASVLAKKQKKKKKKSRKRKRAAKKNKKKIRTEHWSLAR